MVHVLKSILHIRDLCCFNTSGMAKPLPSQQADDDGMGSLLEDIGPMNVMGPGHDEKGLLHDEVGDLNIVRTQP